ncbi:hypothetical protein I588_01190 [Enterococcus pallens ATCC BAA-351]|uniref:HTH araC/xylS-type domain-containing protein n=2 Tax=Enterococcus pallens TaxID=160454 RepID=R2SUK3_9ENTE|nr:hypothetical protein UAU_03076 [Enterococcus pallens ATCC BAA-351]EOU25202.1 hypothetical protein I588_01190 [Enterococcus pallens ATCC BAA-351]
MGMEFELEQVLDLKKWEAVQEAIAIATHLAIVLVDYRGKPVTHHSQVQPFCQRARAHPTLAAYCEKCDARGGLEAVRTGEPYIYRCHFDIVDIAIPIMLDHNYVGAIMAGEIRLDKEQENLEQVLRTPSDPIFSAFIEEYRSFYDNYPVLSLTDLQNTAVMLEKLSSYIVTEAIKKDYLVRTYKQSLRLASRNVSHETAEIPVLEQVRDDVQLSLLENRLTQKEGQYIAKNPLLQPALDAVFINKSSHLSLQELAELTNLSTSYLSRLLKEELGQPFSQFYAELKVRWAKDLLESSNMTISEISDELGYVEASYFVRSFKKIAGITPLKYRKVARKK